MSAIYLLPDPVSAGSCPLHRWSYQQSWSVAELNQQPPLNVREGACFYPLAHRVLTILNPFQGYCPERKDRPFAICPPESQEMTSPRPKALSFLVAPSSQKQPFHLFNRYSFFLILSCHVHCLSVCSAQGLWVLQVVNTVGANPHRAPWAVGTMLAATPRQPPSQNRLFPVTHPAAGARMGRGKPFWPGTNDT